MLWLAVLEAAAEPPQQVVLGNGLTVTVLSDMAMPHLVVQHWIMAGSAADPLTHPGLAHLVEHLMVRDSGLEETIAALGGQLSAYTAPDYTRFTAQVQADALPETLRLLTPVAPSETTLASARRVVSEELAQRGGYTARLRAAIDATYWRAHPYAAAAGWMLVDPDSLTTADCAAFIDARYRPGQTHLVIVGPIPSEEALETVRESYGNIEEEAIVTAKPSHTPPERIALSIGPSPVQLSGLIWPLPPADHPDQLALQLALHGLPGAVPSLMSGALSAGGHISWGRQGSRLLLSGVYSALRTDERLESDLALTTEAARAWLTPERLQSARAHAIRQTLSERLDPMRLARGLGWSAVMRGEVTASEETVRRLEALTLEVVSAAWARWLVDVEPVEVHVDVG